MLTSVVYTYQAGPLMYDNGLRLLANRYTCDFEFIGLNDVLGQTSIRQQLLKVNVRVTARTEIQTGVAWAKLNTN